MSNYFTKKNAKEFGPAPTDKITYLVVEAAGDFKHTRICYVMARTGFEARNEARKVIPDFKDTAFVCYPNPTRIES